MNVKEMVRKKKELETQIAAMTEEKRQLMFDIEKHCKHENKSEPQTRIDMKGFEKMTCLECEKTIFRQQI